MTNRIIVNHVSVTSTYGFFEENGVYHRTMYSHGHQGLRTYPSEAAVREAIEESIEADRQCDDDDARYSRQHGY